MNLLTRLTRWLKSQRPPRALTGNQWGGGFVDAYRRVKTPSGKELAQELRNTAWTCASINAGACARYAPKLYVATHTGEREARCLKGPVAPHHEHKIRSSSHLPTRFTKAARIEEVFEHPLLTLLRQVNPVHNAYDLWELTTLYQEVHGSAYWYVEDGPLGIPGAIWVLPSQNVTPQRGEQRIVDHYLYHGDEEARFRPEEVIHFRYPDPRDPYAAGLSPLRACWEQVMLTSHYVAMKQATFENRAVPDAVVSPAEVIGEEERDRLEAQWNQKFRRGGAGKVLVAESSMKVHLLRQSMGDLAALAEYSATKEDIANAFGTPMAYLTKDTNMANLAAAELQHMSLTIAPRLRRRDEKINEQLIPRYDPSGRLFVASEDPTPESKEQLLKQQQIDLQLGVKTINEVRAERGLPPVKWGKVPWLPLNLKPTDNHTVRQVIEVND